jgi:hypothetical protein
LKLKDLAAQLGISAAMVSKLKKRGMPTASVEAAEKWRRRHLEFARSKGNRAGTERPAPAEKFADVSTPAIELAAAAALARVRRLAELAGDALAGHSFEIVAPMLRQALQAVPPAARQHVAMPLAVWDRLTEAVPGGGGGGAHDFSEEFMATFWYQVALGPELSDHSIVCAPDPQLARNAR